MTSVAPEKTANSPKAGLPNELDEQFTAGRLGLLLGLLFLIAYPDIVLGSHAFFYRDAGLFGYPLAYYLRDCFWRGEIPLWNPYNNCGIPFIAQWNTLALYPPSLFYVLLPMPWSMNYFLLGHLLFAAVGMYYLANAWVLNRFAATVAGLAFAWNGLSLHTLMWPNILAGLAWMPWIVLMVERAWREGKARIIWASFAGTMQMLTGAPEVILVTWIITVLFLLAEIVQKRGQGWRLFTRFLLVVFLISGLSAVQLVPFLDLVVHGNRSVTYGDNTWAMPVWGIANFFVPLFGCTPSVIGVFSQDVQQCFSSYYLGVVLIALALAAVLRIRTIRTALLGVLAVTGVLLAMGDNAGVLPIVKRLLPILGFIRYPIKFVVITLFCIPLLASMAVSGLQRKEDCGTLRRLLAGSGMVGACIVVICLAALWNPISGVSWKLTWTNGAIRLVFLIAVIAALVLVQRLESPKTRLSLAFGVLLLLGLDVNLHVPRQNPTVITRGYESFSPQMAEIPVYGSSRAMISRDIQMRMRQTANPDALNFYLGQRGVLLDNCNLLERIPKVNGFFANYLREEREVETILYGTNPVPKLAEFIGVSQVTSSEMLFAWNARVNYMPIATIGQRPVFADAATTLEGLASPQFAPREIVYLSPGARRTAPAEVGHDATIVSSEYSAHKLRFEIASSDPAILVLSQAFYHLWKPYIDGKPTELLRANHGFQAVVVPPGLHEIRIVYEDRYFLGGAILSCSLVIVCVAVLLSMRFRQSVTIAE